jgi:hypothetical protein
LASFVDAVEFWMKRILELETEAEMLTNGEKETIKNKLESEFISDDFDNYGSWKF